MTPNPAVIHDGRFDFVVWNDASVRWSAVAPATSGRPPSITTGTGSPPRWRDQLLAGQVSSMISRSVRTAAAWCSATRSGG
ncbi:hypothetical protein [Nocardia colli]|uniref:hypothetical protein n=1 Tax=Nocardia colli TaxID=2545717 RepID=UPI00168D972B